MRDTDRECFKDYMSQVPHEPRDPEYRRTIMPLCTFLGVTPETFRHWVRGTQWPSGWIAVRLRHYLEAYGYGVEELLALDPPVRTVSRFVAMNVISPLELQRRLGYKNPQTLLAMLQGASNPVADRVEHIKSLAFDLRAKYDEQIRKYQTQEVLPRELPIGLAPVTPGMPVAETSSVRPETLTASATLLLAFAHQVRAAATLAEGFRSHQWSDAERRFFAEIAGQNGIDQLCSTLHALSTSTPEAQ